MLPEDPFLFHRIESEVPMVLSARAQLLVFSSRKDGHVLEQGSNGCLLTLQTLDLDPGGCHRKRIFSRLCNQEQV